VIDQPRSSQRYEAKMPDDEPVLVKRILELVREHPRYGYRFMTAKLRQEGWHVNRKRVYRLWRREGLKVPQKKRKKRRLGTSENGCHRRRAEHKDHVWCWDFIFDRTTSGSPLKWLTMEDEYTRESLALKMDRSITSEDVIDTLAELLAMRGVPEHIRSDNGPEFIAHAIRRWLEQLDIKTLYIEPGAPWENGYAESFNNRFRDELLAIEEFENVAAARKLGAAWRHDYNNFRPHSSLGYLTPAEYAARCPASAPAGQRSYPTRTLITCGTDSGGRSIALDVMGHFGVGVWKVGGKFGNSRAIVDLRGGFWSASKEAW
jgi:transposase InsO family protein